MRRALIAAAGAALATVAAVGGAATAAPAETSPEIAWAKNIVVVKGNNPDQAIVMTKYRCVGEGVRLWASIKQGPNVTETNNTSADADSWYETPEGPVPQCDGKTHVIRYNVTRVEGFEPLRTGKAWVQFVFFYIDGDGENRAADVGWATVKAPRGK